VRYIAERHAIAFRYHMEDPTTVRDSVAGKQRALNPFRPSEAHSPPDEEPPVEEACVLDGIPFARVPATVRHLLREASTVRSDEWYSMCVFAPQMKSPK